MEFAERLIVFAQRRNFPPEETRNLLIEAAAEIRRLDGLKISIEEIERRKQLNCENEMEILDALLWAKRTRFQILMRLKGAQLCQ